MFFTQKFDFFNRNVGIIIIIVNSINESTIWEINQKIPTIVFKKYNLIRIK